MKRSIWKKTALSLTILSATAAGIFSSAQIPVEASTVQTDYQKRLSRLQSQYENALAKAKDSAKKAEQETGSAKAALEKAQSVYVQALAKEKELAASLKQNLAASQSELKQKAETAKTELNQSQAKLQDLQNQLTALQKEADAAAVKEAQANQALENAKSNLTRPKTEYDRQLQELQQKLNQAKADVQSYQNEYDAQSAKENELSTQAASLQAALQQAAQNTAAAYNAVTARQKELEQSKVNAETSGTARKQEAYDQAKAQYDLGSIGFFSWLSENAPTQAQRSDALNALAVMQATGDLGGHAGFNELTDPSLETDAASLINMKAALRYIVRSNELRVSDDNFTGNSELPISSYLMATSQKNANWSDSVIAHARTYNVGENLAWGWGGDYWDPFNGLYTKEKLIYDTNGEGEVGHYLNITSSDYGATGAAISRDPNGLYPVLYAQNYALKSSRHIAGAMNLTTYTAYFDSYYNSVVSALQQAQNDLENADVTGYDDGVAAAQNALTQAQNDLSARQQEQANLKSQSDSVNAQLTQAKAAKQSASANLAQAKTTLQNAQSALSAHLANAPADSSIKQYESAAADAKAKAQAAKAAVSEHNAKVTIAQSEISSYNDLISQANALSKQIAKIQNGESVSLQKPVHDSLQSIYQNAKNQIDSVNKQKAQFNSTALQSAQTQAQKAYEAAKAAQSKAQENIAVAQAKLDAFARAKSGKVIATQKEKELILSPEAHSVKALSYLQLSDPDIPAEWLDFHSSNPDAISVSSDGTVNATKDGEAVVTVTFPDQSKKQFEVHAAKQDYLYRLYNPNSGEHFYTASLDEQKNLIAHGWNDEGGLGHTAGKTSAPVYRLYNPNASDHHYTKDIVEARKLEKAGWKFEGVAFYSDPQKAGVPVHRLYNPNAKSGAHHYTVSKEEADYLVKVGWRYENTGWTMADLHK
jgi:hypothetical protein